MITREKYKELVRYAEKMAELLAKCEQYLSGKNIQDNGINIARDIRLVLRDAGADMETLHKS